jgi:hypothetical protein
VLSSDGPLQEQRLKAVDNTAMFKSQPKVILLNAIVVFGICLFLLLCGLYGLCVNNPFARFGAFIFLPPSLWIAWCQYRSVIHRDAASTRRLAITFYALAGFFLFGLVSSVLEWLFKPTPPDCTSLGSVGLAIGFAVLACVAAYFAMSARLNWKWYKLLRVPATAYEKSE